MYGAGLTTVICSTLYPPSASLYGLIIGGGYPIKIGFFPVDVSSTRLILRLSDHCANIKNLKTVKIGRVVVDLWRAMNLNMNSVVVSLLILEMIQPETPFF
jgi:hypothetical protein